MTIIYAATADQVLTATILPKLAQNNLNMVRLHVDFDSSWDALTARTAVFTTSKSPKPYEVLLSADGDCLVPPEVLTEECKLFITVHGKAASGATKPSTRLTVKVLPGTPAVIMSDPTPGIYQQLLTAYAVLRARMSGLEAGGTVDGSEVIGIRTGVDGTEYDTAGDAVRGQVDTLDRMGLRRIYESIHRLGTPSVNLFDHKNQVFTEKGNIYSHSSTDINTPVKVSNTVAYSTIFPARPGVTYTGTHIFNYIVYFDRDGKKISYNNDQIGGGVESYTFTTPSGCWYVGLAFRSDYIQPEEIMVVEGEELPSEYVPFALTLREDVQLPGVSVGTVTLSPGDSIQEAVDLGAQFIYLQPGDYGAQKVNITNRDEIKICVVNEYKGERVTKPNVVIDNSVLMPVVSSGGLAVADAIFSTTSNWYKVFVSGELEPVRTGLRSTSYNAILWQTNPADASEDVKLIPVLTLDSCKATAGTFYYEHTAGKVYIHPKTSDFSGLEFRRLIIEEGSLFNIENVKSLYVENIEVKYAPESFYIFKTNECNVTSCKASHTAYGSAFNISASNGNFRNCEAYKACGDGFGVGGNGLGIGHMSFYDCQGHHNYDDGVSHHNGSTGAVYGGEWHHNVKGGVAPAHGSVVQMHNIISHHNGYGFYIESDEKVPAALGREMNMVGCLAYDNTYGVSVKRYHVKAYSCNFEDNDHPVTVQEDENSSLTLK